MLHIDRKIDKLSMSVWRDKRVLTYVSMHYLRQWVGGGEGGTAGRGKGDERNENK